MLLFLSTLYSLGIRPAQMMPLRCEMRKGLQIKSLTHWMGFIPFRLQPSFERVSVDMSIAGEE